MPAGGLLMSRDASLICHDCRGHFACTPAYLVCSKQAIHSLRLSLLLQGRALFCIHRVTGPSLHWKPYDHQALHLARLHLCCRAIWLDLFRAPAWQQPGTKAFMIMISGPLPSYEIAFGIQAVHR